MFNKAHTKIKPSFPDERMRVFTITRNGVFIMTGFYYIEGSGFAITLGCNSCNKEEAISL